MDSSAYRFELTCPRCSTSGEAEVTLEERDRPKEVWFTIDRISKGFYASKITDSPDTSTISCSKCGDVVW
jgi:hypothetical protein